MNKKVFSVIAGITIAASLLFSGCGISGQLKDGLIQRLGTVFDTEQEEDIHKEADVTETEEKEQVKQLSASCYAYQTLPQEVRNVYDEIYDAMVSYKEDIVVDTLDKDILDEAYHCVMADHGGVFWVSGYSYTQYTRGEELVRIQFSPKYTMEQEERDQIQSQIDVAADQILEGIQPEAGDYEKAKYVFEYLASKIAYDPSASDNQNIISVFLNKATVCQGYACATQYLLEKLGITSAVVTGWANGTAHAWNIAKLDGEYYYIDTTWGNASYSAESADSANYINYSYFAVTTETLEVTHSPNEELILPLCTAVRDNYYVHENLFFAECDRQAVGEVLADAYYSGEEFCSVKFGDSMAYQEAFDWFLTEQHIIDYCKDMKALYYIEDPVQNVLTVKF